MITNTRPGALPAQGEEGFLHSPRLRALRACESRIRELQNLRPLHHPGDLQQRRAWLRTEVDRALRTARACVAEGDFRQAGPDTLAGMMNSFSKMRQPPAAHDIDAIMACIGRELGERAATGSLARWSPKYLSIMANGLSKSQGSWARQALTHLARALVAVEGLRPAPGWTAQDLAMMVAGLSKGEGPCIQQALAHLAQAVPGVQQLTQASGWTPRSLVMVVNGLAKGEGVAVQDALARCAQAISRCDLSGPWGWNAQDLAMAVNGLVKGEGPAIAEALAHLARAIPAAWHLTAQYGWHAQTLAMVANGLGKGTGPCVQAALERLAQGLLTGRHLIAEEGWSLQALAMMANGLSKGNSPCITPALERVAQGFLMMQPLIAEEDWSAQSLAMLANGLSRGEGPCIQQALECLAQVLLRVWHRIPEAGWDARNLAMMVNGFGKAEGPSIERARSCLTTQICRLPLTALQGWTAMQLAMTANGLSRGELVQVQEALHHLALAVSDPGFRMSPPWRTLDLAMMANGLGKGEGSWVSAALERLAGAVLEQDLPATESWTARPLAMMANALAKGEGPCAGRALTHLARILTSSSAVLSEPLLAQDLAMMTHGLARGEGEEILAALVCLARALPDARALTREAGWTAQRLALMTHGLGKGELQEEREVQEALARLAQAIIAFDPAAGAQEWNTRLLVMTAKGLCKSAVAPARRALAHLAGLACQVALAQEYEGNTQDLAIMMDAMGQALVDHAVFGQLTAALVPKVCRAPVVVQGLLRFMSRYALSPAHLTAASRLLEALRDCDFRPDSQRDLNVMLWNITLFHCASVQQRPADLRLAVSFAQSWHHYRHCALTGGGDDKEASLFDDHWHDSWACDYWQPSARRRVPVTRGQAAVCLPHIQSLVFERLKKELPGHDVWQEVWINQFPVDILIDGCVCVEVDGPDHFVEMLAAGDGQAGGTLVRQRRSKDLFIDHMLRQYGYRVFRIDLAQDAARLDTLVRQVRAALDSSALEAGASGQQVSAGDRQQAQPAPGLCSFSTY